MNLTTYLNPDVIKDGDISASKISAINKSITWSELKALRDAGELIPGMQYRITDYQCTTTQEDTRSAGHQFDIIVRADSENKLNEEASAIQHEGDEYFANNNLSAWKIWYCLDNDTDRFAWADSTNGKGVIYRMIDEWNNDVPYDFKNIIYVFTPYFIYGASFVGSLKFIRNSSKDMIIDGTQYYGYLNTKTNTEYWIKEDSPSYDSKLYDRNGNYSNANDGWINDISSDDYETYTFGKSNDFTITTNSCYNNIILPYNNIILPYNQGILTLNKNIFDSNCYDNVFYSNCYSNTLGSNCFNNKFESNCFNNKFNSDCHSNIFGNTCQGNTFGDDCKNNTFGNECSNNAFGSYCSYNSFGNGCCSIKFASYDSEPTKYNYYMHNHFSDGCYGIIFKGPETASSFAVVQNYDFAQGLKSITVDGVRNRDFETRVEKDSNGNLKEYCLADLIYDENDYSYYYSAFFIGEI